MIKLKSPWVLGPLAGITDAAMRTLCEEQGAALTYTEMVSAKGLYYGDKKTSVLTYIPENAGPTALQIFGSEPDIMAAAADKLNGLNHALLDINMGCPVPKVVRNGDGSALMRDPELVYKVVKATADASAKPVTVKIRSGFTLETINAVEVAQAIEAGGAAAVAVHGRTRSQYYSGEADWSIIRDVNNAVSIPVIGNGDVCSAADGLRMMEETGCDYVMIARAALGNPWLFKELDCAYRGEELPPAVSEDEKLRMMLRHLDMLLELKREHIAVAEFRKFVVWYTKGMRGAAKLRQEVNHIDNADEFKEVILSENWRKA
ncbi:MAG: tRNA dihydrouridine synthase DusB [Clostridiales bacterium]|nr:tRNA dihydrouridine synthase DusB [Candidatus Crickella caballi]